MSLKYLSSVIEESKNTASYFHKSMAGNWEKSGRVRGLGDGLVDKVPTAQTRRPASRFLYSYKRPGMAAPICNPKVKVWPLEAPP